jgi:hypothetical protein
MTEFKIERVSSCQKSIKMCFLPLIGQLFKGINREGINRANVADFLIKQAEKQT